MDTIKSLKPNIVVVLNIIKLNATDSTNSYLKKLAHESHIEDPTIVISEAQKKGRGQMGNSWTSIKGQSLTFSVFKKFDGLLADQQFAISMVTSLALAEAFGSLGVTNISIKWPNDILSGNKKITGILIENVLEGVFIKHSVIGIGINVNEMEFENLPQASSLKLETGINFNLEEVLDVVLNILLQKLELISQLQFWELRHLYEKKMFRRNLISVFENPAGLRFNGIIKGISDNGELIVATENKPNDKYQLKDLRLIF